MLFGYFTLLVALVISAVAAYYSIVGLTAIFSAAVIPIIVMGGALEVGKITAAVWLKLNWARARWTFKLYLVPAVAFLMLLTSMGIFGFLSKAHSDQNLVSGDALSRLAIYDEKIKTARENIDANRKALTQMDQAVDQTMSRSTSEQGADRAVAIRRSQQKERSRLLSEIDSEQKTISRLNEERAPIAADVRKVEAEVGPIKYVAALIYGDNPDGNLLERAVRWVIILIVAVFDPLALVLILAAQQSLRWNREEKSAASRAPDPEPVGNIEAVSPVEEIIELDENPSESIQQAETKLAASEPIVTELESSDPIITDQPPTQNTIQKDDYSISEKTHGYLFKKFARAPRPELIEPALVVTAQNPVQDPVQETKIPETRKRVKVFQPAPPETLNIRRLQTDNEQNIQFRSGFGIQFPDNAGRGDMFLRVDQLPNKLFKFNGDKWIEIDKDKTDSYIQDAQYIDFLIKKLELGEYEIDQLSAAEQDMVAQRLQREK